MLVLSDSSSLTIQQHSETFGGRMGNGKTVNVLPLSFRDFYFLFYRDFLEGKGREIFEKYLVTGGFLAVLNKRLREYEFVSLIKSDFKK